MQDPEESPGVIPELEELVRRAALRGPGALEDDELCRLPILYRRAATLLARKRDSGQDPERRARLEGLVLAAHGLLHAKLGAGARAPFWRTLVDFFMLAVPRAVRAEWRLLAASCGLMYGLALIAGIAVSRDLSLAHTLFDPAAVNIEIQQLSAMEEGEPFRGNFTFGLEESAGTTGYIMGNNMRVAVLFFASALIPPLYLIVVATNGLMLGTYTAVASHWDQAGAISSMLWCHGMLELQAFILAGTAGLLLLRGLLAPGPWSRGEALRREGLQAWKLVAPAFPMLLISGLIEGFITPHAGLAVRLGVAIGSGAFLLLWFGFSGRRVAPLAGA